MEREKRLNGELRRMAIEKGLCDAWQADWEDDKSVDTLISMWKRGIDFAIERDYPPLEYIKGSFTSDELADNLVFIDEAVAVADGENGVYVVNGECGGKMSFSGFSAAVIYVRHKSEIEITASGNSIVFVHCHDDACVTAVQRGAARMTVYGKGVGDVSTMGNVRVRDKKGDGI